MVSIDRDERPDIRFQSLDVIRWMHCRIDARDAGNGDDILQKVREQLEEGVEKNDGLPLAVRIEIAGPSHSHASISADSDRWTNEIRAAAIDSGGSEIWIEKTKFRTRFPEEPDESGSGPMGELFSFLDEVRADPESLKFLDESLSNLRKKLRRELKGNADAVFPNDPEWMLHRLDEVKTMLIRRLSQKGDAL